MRRTFQALMVILLTAVMIGGTVSPALAGTSRASGSLRWVYMSGSATGGKAMTVRVTLWGEAPASGAFVFLSSSNPIVTVPGMVTIPAGKSEIVVKVKTQAVNENTPVVVMARLGDRVRRTNTTVLRPYLSSTTVQTRIRSGGLGKIIVRLSGIAPDGGVTVRLNSNRPSILPVPATVYFPAGKASVSINAPAARVGRDVHVNVTATYRGIKITKPTIVRKYGVTTTDDPTATAAASPTAPVTVDETDTATSEPTVTATTASEAPATATAEVSGTAEVDLTATSISQDQTATIEAELTATQRAIDETATQESIDATATQQSIDATSTQTSIDQTATRQAEDATATADASATEAANAAATQQANDATATQQAIDATATQIAIDETATQTSIDATATQTAADATATQIAIDESAGAYLICHSTGAGAYNPLTLSYSGIFNGHLGSTSGEHGGLAGDIIPPFDYKGVSYEQNWGEAGQAIYNNGCQPLPEQGQSELPQEIDETNLESNEPVAQSLAVWVDSQSAPKGGTVTYSACLAQPTTADVTISWTPGQAQFDDPVNTGSVTIPAGSSGAGLCVQVAFSGLNRGHGAPTGTGNLRFTLSDGQLFAGPEVHFKGN